MLEVSKFEINFIGKFVMKTVLLVEDEPINVTIFSKILTKRGGLAVLHTENVAEVMKIAQSGEADIILMDICLLNSYYQGKGIDGIEITKMLKADPQTAKVPVILVTANAREGEGGHLIERSGADGFIPKPIVDHQKFVDQVLANLPVESH
jgi:two-component system cell cycle response regulator DivK